MTNKPVVKCSRCEGKGYIVDQGERLFWGAVTLGLMPLFDKLASRNERDSDFSTECKKCKGDGWIVLKD